MLLNHICKQKKNKTEQKLFKEKGETSDTNRENQNSIQIQIHCTVPTIKYTTIDHADYIINHSVIVFKLKMEIQALSLGLLSIEHKL